MNSKTYLATARADLMVEESNAFPPKPDNTPVEINMDEKQN